MKDLKLEADEDFYRDAQGCVALIARVPSNEPENAIAAYSGFLVEVGSKHFWVTAAHVLEVDPNDASATKHSAPLDELVEEFKDVSFTLRPAAGNNSSETAFKYSGATRITCWGLARTPDIPDDVRERLLRTDIGAILIDPLYVENLQATGCVPFTFEQARGSEDNARALANAPELSASIIGVPAILAKADSETNSFSAPYAKLAVAPVEFEGDTILCEPCWDEAEVPFDVKGCSGGPLVVTGEDKSYVVGVQYAQIRINGRFLLKVAGAARFINTLKLIADNLDSSTAIPGHG